MSHKAYTITICIIGFLTSVAFAILEVLGIISAPWWAVWVPVILSRLFTWIEYDDYQRVIEEDEVSQQLTLMCNNPANAELINMILEADAQGKIVMVANVEEYEEESEETDEEEKP